MYFYKIYMYPTLYWWIIEMTFASWWFCWRNSNFKLQMPLEKSICHKRFELYNSSFQLVKLKTSKRKLLLNRDSATVSIGVSFIMCMHIFLFLSELSNYVISFVVGATVVLFKYIGNKTSMIFTRYKPPIFFILSFVTYTEYLRFRNHLYGDIETNPGLFNRCKFISFCHWNLNGLLTRNREMFRLVEAFVVPNNIDIFGISR